MKKFSSYLLFLVFVLLAGCSEEQYEAIPVNQPFVASVNIVDGSIHFIDDTYEKLAVWAFDEAITGAEVVGEDTVVVYGHQLETIRWISLSTGQVTKEQEVGIGTTNVYYDKHEELIYITNNKTNRLIAYSRKGEKQYEVPVKNYPMSLIADEQSIYVINYKDTVLSVIDKRERKVVNEWSIPKSSHGIYIQNDRLWIGGHGEGREANRFIQIYDMESGERLESIELPIMPIGVTEFNHHFYVVSHGNSTVHRLDETYKLQWEKQIGANPFAITYFNQQVVVAGYDDHTIYFVSEEGDIIQSVEVGKGPFQLIVRR